MLPTMATHGCAPQHHRSQTEADHVITEECTRCGYRISYGPARVSYPFLLPLSQPTPRPCTQPVSFTQREASTGWSPHRSTH